jgi:hypothetical protein
MKLTVERGPDDGTAILGRLLANGIFECYTLEPSASRPEYPCIPAGTYPVEMLESPRFGQITPHLQNVPGRSLIEIHPGNNAEDTEGCLLVGQTESKDWIGSSRVAFLALMALLMPNARGLTITYQNAEASQ